MATAQLTSGTRAHHTTSRLTPASGAHTPSAWASIHGGLWLLHHGWHPVVTIVTAAVVTIAVVVVHHGRPTHAWHHTPLQDRTALTKVCAFSTSATSHATTQYRFALTKTHTCRHLEA